MRARLVFLLALVAAPTAPASAAPDIIEGHTAGVQNVSCTAGPTCTSFPWTPRWAACQFDRSVVTGTGSTASTACWAEINATIGPNPASINCERLTGTGTVKLFSTLGGTWTVPIEVGPVMFNAAGFSGTLVSGNTVVRVEGGWGAACGTVNQWALDYRIVHT